MQGKGVHLPPPGYLEGAQALCRRYGTLFCVDEVQTGFGRTGKLFAFEHWGLEPDLVPIAKSLSGGYVPVGALLMSTRRARGACSTRWSTPFSHGSTFAPNELAMAAGLATLHELDEQDLVERTARLGARLLELTLPLVERYDVVRDVRGLGLMWAIEFGEPAVRAALVPAGRPLQHGLFAQLVVVPLFTRAPDPEPGRRPRDPVIKGLPPLDAHRGRPRLVRRRARRRRSQGRSGCRARSRASRSPLPASGNGLARPAGTLGCILAIAVHLRFGAAILALVAAAVGVVVAVVAAPLGARADRRDRGSSGAAAFPPRRQRRRRSPAAASRPRTAPPSRAPPPGRSCLGREAGTRALGARGSSPARPRSLLRVSVLGEAGDGAAGLKVTARIRRCRAGGAAGVRAGAATRRSSRYPAHARLLTVSLDGVPLPLRPAGAPPGAPRRHRAIVDRAATTWRRLKSLVWRERLAGSPTAVIHSVFRAVAPDRLSYAIEGGSSAVIIGGTRWDRQSRRHRGSDRRRTRRVSQPSPFWAEADDAHIVGTTAVGGRKAWLVSFFDPTTPAWFTATIDEHNYRTLRLHDDRGLPLHARRLRAVQRPLASDRRLTGSRSRIAAPVG